MDFPLLALFLLNMVMILVDASVGYHMAPKIMEAINDLEDGEAGVRTTRKLLSAVVALYMFFNCTGYFQGRLSYLLTVCGLIVFDLALQFYLFRRRRTAGDDEHDDY
jgi:hypothetical protein